MLNFGYHFKVVARWLYGLWRD